MEHPQQSRQRHRLRDLSHPWDTQVERVQAPTGTQRSRLHHRHGPTSKDGLRLVGYCVVLLLLLGSGRARASDDALLDHPPLHFFYALAKCETGWGRGQLPRWTRNSTNYEGGLGIHRATWNDYTAGDPRIPGRGGDATIAQQIEVALRIARVGWYDKRRRVFVKPVGWYGWGCVKHSIGDPRGILRNGKRSRLYDPKRITDYVR